MQLYREYRDRIAGVVEIPEFNPKTTGYDLSELLKSRRPLREALEDPNVLLMSRQRLRMAQRELYGRLEQVGLL